MIEPERPAAHFTPDEERIAALLQDLRPQPTGRFYKRLASAPWKKKTIAHHGIHAILPSGRNRFLWIAPALFIFVVIVAGLAFPSLPATARQLMRFFIPNPSDRMTLEVTVPSPEDPQVFGAPGYFSLSLEEVEKAAGFEVKEIIFPANGSPIPEIAFSGAHFDADLQAVNLRYTVGGNSLYFSQRASGNIEEYSSIGAGAPVEPVTVRGVEGEFVAGGWRSNRVMNSSALGTLQPGTQVSLDILWDHDLPQRILRWQEDQVYYEILCSAGLGRKWLLDKEAMLKIAGYVK